ncbi:MAG: HEAT repeat domain-containing protein [Planctomycetota bacterium]
MRGLVGLFLLTGVALAHGESGRTTPTVSARPMVPPGQRPGSGPATVRPTDGGSTWRTWWAYNREWILAGRIRGTPTSGVRRPDNDRLTRKQLREGELYDRVLRALDDKWHDVRAAAAVSLGKFGLPRADRHLQRRSRHPPEKWYDVRESCIYGMGVLGLEENRKTMTVVAGDKERGLKERSLALVSFLMDGTQASADLLVWHLKYFRSGILANAETAPLRSEQDRRRMAAHLLGFVTLDGYDNLLMAAAAGSRRWDDGVRGLAITALGRRGVQEYREPLFRMFLRRDLDRNVRRSIPLALGMMIERKDRSDVKRLARFIRDHKRDPVVQHFTVMALAGIGGDQVVDIFEDLLRRRVFNNAEDRAFVYLGLGLVGSRSGKAREILWEEYRRKRTEAAWSVLAVACGLARVSEAVPLTIERLGQSHLSGAAPPGDRRGRRRDPARARNRVREPGFLAWGCLALGLHGDPRAVPVVRKVFKKYHDGQVRAKAAIALSLLRKQAAVPELVEILRDAGTMYTKAAVVTALGILPEPSREAVDALVRAYRDDSMPNSVRAMAIIALGALGDPRPVPLSAQLTRNYNYFIRCVGLDEIASLL